MSARPVAVASIAAATFAEGSRPMRPVRRGTSNTNDRGSSYDRRARRAWLLATFGDGTTAPCFRCGVMLDEETLTVDRITPGVAGGSYRRGNIRPTCAADNSELGGRLAAGRPVVLAVDPGPIPGVVRIGSDGAADLAQVTAALLPMLLRALIEECRVGPHGGPLAVIAVERFVVGARAVRSTTPAAGELTRRMVGAVEALGRELGVPVRVRPMGEISRWATDQRLEAAGLLAPSKGMQHARAAARHALYAAVSDAGHPDPLSRKARA